MEWKLKEKNVKKGCGKDNFNFKRNGIFSAISFAMRFLTNQQLSMIIFI